MKKILVFIDWYLPGYKAGGPIRSMANMIAALKQDFQFYVVCRDSDYLESAPYPGIKTETWTKLSENEYVFYLSSDILSASTIQNLIKNTDFQIVYINGIYSFYFSILPLFFAKRFGKKPIIVAPRGMLSGQAFSAKKLKKKVFIAITKLIGLYKNITFHLTSESEKKDILLLKLKSAKAELLPNLPPFMQQIKSTKTEKSAGTLRLVSIARISPEKNTLFAIEVLQKFNYKGKIVFDLYGSVYHKAYWKQCLDLISQLPKNIEVTYKGELNNALVTSTLGKYHFLFLPSTGENFGHSILESFMAGCPVIISNTTPWKNLEAQNLGWDIELKQELFAGIIQKAINMDHENYMAIFDACIDFAVKTTENKSLIDGYKRFFS